MLKWQELAHDKNCYLYPTVLYWLAAQFCCNEVGIKDRIIGCWYKQDEFSYLTTENAFVDAGKIILNKLEKDDKLLNKIEKVNNTQIDIMLDAAKKLSGNLSKLSGKELHKRYKDWHDKFISMMTYSVMGTVMEMEEPLLSNRIEEILKIKLKNDQEKIGEYFQILTSSTRITISTKEEIGLVHLKLKEIEGKLYKKDIKGHLNKYSFLGFGYNGPAWTEEDIKKRLNDLPKEIDILKKEIKTKQNTGQDTEQKQRRIEKSLNFNNQESRLFNALRILGFWKFERKFLNQKAHLLMIDFINEIARRNHLTLKQTFMISPDEYKKVLIDNEVDVKLLNERLDESFVIFNGINYKVLSGNAVKKILDEVIESLKVDNNITELSGNTAYPGKVKGIIKRVDNASEMSKINNGDILLSTSTNPQIVPAMKKAGAIITDSGGITCHAAIVSRELKVPCIIGTKIATKVFKDGDKVEVDADKGIIKKI